MLKTLTCTLIVILFFLTWPQPCLPATSILEGNTPAVLLQGFHWQSHTGTWWNTIREKTDEIAEIGFDMVWFPPSSDSLSDEGYLPRRLYLQDSKYGTRDDLKRAIQSLHQVGIKVIADIIINHRVGNSGWADFSGPAWGPDAVCSTDEWGQGTGNPDTGLNYPAARDVDHTQDFVRKSVVQWMKWLQTEIGYDGWRYDFVPGFHANFVTIYNNATQPYLSIGEFWPDFQIDNPDFTRQAIVDWIDSSHGSSAAFDYATKGVLQHVVRTNEFWRLRDRDGRPSGMLGWWPSHSVTFIDNHDTGLSPGGGQLHWRFPEGMEKMGYAYILTHPGIPCVYWPHLFETKDADLKNTITTLVQLRKKLKITPNSPIEILAADNEKYAAIIDGKLVVKLGTGNWSPSGDFKLILDGDRYKVWEKTL